MRVRRGPSVITFCGNWKNAAVTWLGICREFWISRVFSNSVFSRGNFKTIINKHNFTTTQSLIFFVPFLDIFFEITEKNFTLKVICAYDGIKGQSKTNFRNTQYGDCWGDFFDSIKWYSNFEFYVKIKINKLDIFFYVKLIFFFNLTQGRRRIIF